MRTRHTTTAAAAVLLLTLTACGTGSDDTSLTAQKVADHLSDAHTVGLGEQHEAPVDDDPDDPTAELARIDTDRVIIYELKSPKAATDRAKAMSSVTDARPQHHAGPFVLSWRTDDVPSNDAYMDTLNKALDKLVAEEGS
jgi:predicted outer membrane protein